MGTSSAVICMHLSPYAFLLLPVLMRSHGNFVSSLQSSQREEAHGPFDFLFCFYEQFPLMPEPMTQILSHAEPVPLLRIRLGSGSCIPTRLATRMQIILSASVQLCQSWLSPAFLNSCGDDSSLLPSCSSSDLTACNMVVLSTGLMMVTLPSENLFRVFLASAAKPIPCA